MGNFWILSVRKNNYLIMKKTGHLLKKWVILGFIS